MVLAVLAIAALAAPAAHAAEEEGTPQFVTLGELGKVNPNDAAVMPPANGDTSTGSTSTGKPATSTRSTRT